jgi:hypothetical protein
MTENIFWHTDDRKLLADEQQIGQLAAKKKQSINSSCVPSVLRSDRK